MEILTHAPSDWDDSVRSAALLVGFTEAHRRLGYQVYYLRSEAGCATLHVRGSQRFGALRRRAYVFCEAQTATFFEVLLGAARTLKIPLLRLGNPIYGVPHLPTSDTYIVVEHPRHTFVTDLTVDMDAIVQEFSSARRRNINKAKRSGIIVQRVQSVAEMSLYSRLTDETTQRIRERGYHRAYPLDFFTTLFDTMVPKDQAFCLLAAHHGQPLAGGFFTLNAGTAVYYHGCSTRQEGAGSQQAASLVFLEALVYAKERGCTRFDWGGCSPEVPKDDSRFGVYQYKKGWGGQLVSFYNGDVWVSWPVAWLQERLLGPAYERLRRYTPHFAERVYR